MATYTTPSGATVNDSGTLISQAPTPAPSDTGTGSYTIQKGDTLSAISAQYGESMQNLLKDNPNIKNPNLIQVGQAIQIGKKYLDFFNANKKTQAPDTGGQARQDVQNYQQQNPPPTPTTTPNVAAYFQTPQFLQSLQELQQIMSPQQTTQDIMDQMSKIQGEQATLSQEQLQSMNLNTIMSGTTDDIRNEVAKAGGQATESQVQALATTRNNVLLKQASYLQNQMDYQQSLIANDTNLLQFEKDMASTQFSNNSALANMILTNQQNVQQAAIDKYNNIIKNGGGYTTLANSLMAADPTGQQLKYASYLLGANLSDPVWLAQADQYNAAKVQLEQAKATQAVYNYQRSGGNTATGNYGTATTTISNLIGVNPNTPLSQVNPSNLAFALMKNEGSSLPGVVNNPGNIKYVGLPGQIDSGVQARDGGTFASYATPQAGQKAILADIQGADQNQTLGSFVDKYTNTAPRAVGTTGYSYIEPSIPGYSSQSIVGGMTQAAIDQAAIQYATSGTLPTGARSSTGTGLAIASAVKNRAAELNFGGNLSANKAQLTALNDSLKTQTDYLTNTQRALTGADNSFNQIISKFQAAGINDKSMPIANVLSNLAKYGLGNSDVPAFKAGLAELGNEYQQVFSRGGSVTDTVRKTANDIIDGNISLNDLQKVNNELQSQGQIVVGSAQMEVNKITNQISNIVGGKPPVTKGNMSDNDFVNKALSNQGISYNQALGSIPSGKVGVIDNSTGQIGSVLPSEFDPSLYTKL